MLTRALVRNRQFMGACTTLLLFGIGMMGALFMIVLTFVNLWGYSEIKAALAITPVAIVAMLVSPLVGRLSSRVAPRAFGGPGAARDGGGPVRALDAARGAVVRRRGLATGAARRSASGRPSPP